MEKKIIILLIFLTTILNGCNYKEDNSKIEPQAVEISENIKVEVDPRIELLTTIQYLANYDKLSVFDLDYKKDIEEYFKDYKDHEAVVNFRELSKERFDYARPIVYILNCTKLPDLELSQTISYSSDLLYIGVEDLNKFRKKAKDFYEETNFKDFYNDHEKFYKEILSGYTENKEIESDILALEDYTGYKQKSYNIILSPLTHSGGYGPSLNKENQKYDAYQVIGPIVTQEIYEEYDKDVEKLKSISHPEKLFKLNKGLLLHEFTHTHLRNMDEPSYSSILNSKEPQNQVNLENTAESVYNTWDAVVNEYFVRAITARILILEDEKEEYQVTIKNDKQTGFKYIEILTEKLKEYENNRKKYKKIEDFYPELLDELVKQYY